MVYVPLMLFGAGTALTASVISTLSKEAINTDWGYSPISVKNTVKVGILSAVSSVLVITGYDKFEQWRRSER